MPAGLVPFESENEACRQSPARRGEPGRPAGGGNDGAARGPIGLAACSESKPSAGSPARGGPARACSARRADRPAQAKPDSDDSDEARLRLGHCFQASAAGRFASRRIARVGGRVAVIVTRLALRGPEAFTSGRPCRRRFRR